MKIIYKNNPPGFTLIELLVVIAIIGILSSVVLASLSGARESARDTRRQQDIRQIDTALQMYLNDNTEPPSGGGNSYGWYTSSYTSWDSSLGSDLSEYIDSLPKDPVNDGNLRYWYNSTQEKKSSGNPCHFDPANDSYILVFGVEANEPERSQYSSDSIPQYCVVR